MASNIPTEHSKAGFSFAVIGDCKSEVCLVEPEPFRQNIRSINLLMPDFVVILGDFVKGDTHEDLLGEAWNEFERVARVLKMPYYLVIGNHDVQCRSGEKMFRERFGSPYYCFDYGNSHFIVLNSEDKEGRGDISGRQLEWLRKDLKAHSEAEHIFVFVHRPLWESERNWNKKIHHLLVEHKVDMVFAGHNHRYKAPMTRDGIKYIVTGGGGSVPMGSIKEDEGIFYHWVYATVRGDEVNLAVIRPEGLLSEGGKPLPSWKELNWIHKRSFGPAFIDALREVPFSEDINIRIRNPLKFPVHGTIEWFVPDGWDVIPRRMEYSVKPQSETELYFKVNADEKAKLAYPLPWYESILRWKKTGEPIATGRSGIRLRRRFVCRKTERKIVVDGNLDDWQDFEPLRLNRKEQVVGHWEGVDDLSAKIFLAWDENYLYFAAEVRDDYFCQESFGGDSWQGDSVQISFDTLNDDRSELDEGDYEYAFALTPKGKEAFRLSVEGSSIRGEEDKDLLLAINIKSEEGLHIYEAAIPWSQLKPFKPRRGAVCGFNVVVNDNDGDGPKSWIGWTPGIRESKDTSYFGELLFK